MVGGGGNSGGAPRELYLCCLSPVSTEETTRFWRRSSVSWRQFVSTPCWLGHVSTYVVHILSVIFTHCRGDGRLVGPKGVPSGIPGVIIHIIPVNMLPDMAKGS